MTDLVDFLLARIAEDEAVARGATPGPWRESNDQNVYGDGDASNEPIAVGPWNGEVGDSAAHIARHDPARVLAECEAKRRIVDSCRIDHEDSLASGDDGTTLATEVLCLLALLYADHPAYDQAWQP